MISEPATARSATEQQALPNERITWGDIFRVLILVGGVCALCLGATVVSS